VVLEGASGFYGFEVQNMSGPELATGLKPITDLMPKGDQTTGAAPTVAEQLTQLAALHQAGDLSDEEFRAAKAGLLNPGLGRKGCWIRYDGSACPRLGHLTAMTSFR
jgi:hypothetical protein